MALGLGATALESESFLQRALEDRSLDIAEIVDDESNVEPY